MEPVLESSASAFCKARKEEMKGISKRVGTYSINSVLTEASPYFSSLWSKDTKIKAQEACREARINNTFRLTPKSKSFSRPSGKQHAFPKGFGPDPDHQRGAGKSGPRFKAPKPNKGWPKGWAPASFFNSGFSQAAKPYNPRNSYKLPSGYGYLPQEGAPTRPSQSFRGQRGGRSSQWGQSSDSHSQYGRPSQDRPSYQDQGHSSQTFSRNSNRSSHPPSKSPGRRGNRGGGRSYSRQ